MALDRLAQLAKEFSDLYDLKDEISARMKQINNEFDRYKLEIIPDAMAQEEMTTATVAGVGRLGLTVDAWVSLKDKDAGFRWLRDNGHGDIVIETVNASTLKAFLKDCKLRGEEFPEDIFKFDPYTRASLTRR